MKILTAFFLVMTMSLYPAPLLAATAARAAPDPNLQSVLQKSYLDLFREAPEMSISDSQLSAWKQQLEDEKDREEERLESEKERIEKQIDQAQDRLDDLNESVEDSADIEERRHDLHCEIQRLRQKLQEKKLILERGLDIEYDNKIAKVEIAKEWPEEYRQTKQALQGGPPEDWKFTDFRDIGFRGGPFEGQEEDVQKGREAVDELKRKNMLPPEIEDQEVMAYMNTLGNRIARHSDLRVPLKLSVLRSNEINAFALPGGFLFVNSGLIEKAQHESELAGVIAHEIAHAAARHGDRLMGKAQIANIVMQAAQIAALVLTGGASSIATYYLMQYGFYGLGLVLNLSLLGISRDFEIEADILGTQYLWDAGYELTGFVEFFQRMAQEEGYVTGLSWFRTHPPFAKRMQRTYKEMMYLPDLEDPKADSEQFHNMKQRLTRVLEEMKQQDREAPTMKRVYDCEYMNESNQNQ